MGQSAEALERFNRKERNLLIRDALGHGTSPPRLCKGFRERIADKLKPQISVIPDDAWWATDYHFDWLAGALTLYAQGDAAIGQPLPNVGLDDMRLVQGKQEDVDLVIAFGSDLILAEAKAYGAYSNKQSGRKRERLRLLGNYCNSLPMHAAPPVRLHFLHISPTKPQRLDTGGWPVWVLRSGEVPHVELKLAGRNTVLEVNRHDQDGQCWSIKSRAISRLQIRRES